MIYKNVVPLHSQTRNKVPWMSGLVYGLQNRLRRFESARHLAKRAVIFTALFFCLYVLMRTYAL